MCNHESKQKQHRAAQDLIGLTALCHLQYGTKKKELHTASSYVPTADIKIGRIMTGLVTTGRKRKITARIAVSKKSLKNTYH